MSAQFERRSRSALQQLYTERSTIELKVFPGAYHGFDIPRDKPIGYFGHHLAFDQAASDQASDMLRAFLAAHVGERR